MRQVTVIKDYSLLAYHTICTLVWCIAYSISKSRVGHWDGKLNATPFPAFQIWP